MQYTVGTKVRKRIESPYDAIPVGTEGVVTVTAFDGFNIRWQGLKVDYGYLPYHSDLIEPMIDADGVRIPSKDAADVSPYDIYD